MTPAEITAIVLDAFAYLMNDFGFEYLSTSTHSPECWSTFQNVTTSVTVHYEIGSQPWVEFSRLQRIGNRVVEVDRSALEFLVQERAPQVVPSAISSLDDAKVRQLIYEKARQLHQYGSDILRGDFQVFPRLRELADANLRRRNATEGS